MEELLLRLEKIGKDYPGVRALDDISLDFKRGQVHAIVGENGAGKSTLIKIITGAERPSQGRIYYKGQELATNSPAQSSKMGIHAVYQELNMLPALSIAENIFLGQELSKGLFLDKTFMRLEAQKLLSELGLDLDAQTKLGEIGMGSQQLVEIAKALVKKVDLLILDEPTAALTNREIENLFRIIADLKSQGVAIIYISHRLDEIFRIADEITVFRDGQLVHRGLPKDLDEKTLVSHMVGRELKTTFTEETLAFDKEEVLELKGVTTRLVHDISFSLQKGEILGIAGLISSGRTELAQAIFGLDKILSGEIHVHGERALMKSPREAIDRGIALITEDRKDQGLVLGMPIVKNVSYASLDQFSSLGFVNRGEETAKAKDVLSQLRAKYSSLYEKVVNLSGGNQQKVVIAKWLLTDCDIFIFDEPTRGVDVGAKEEIYAILRELSRAGKSILLISSEMEEVMALSDRILVMSNGRIASSYRRGDYSSEQIFIDSASLLKERKHDENN